MRKAAESRFHYAWVVAATTFMIVIVSAGTRASPGVLMLPLEREFGWDRAGISGAVAISLFLYGFLGPFSASFIDRYGLRRVITCSLLLLTAAVALSGLMTDLWHLYALWGVFVGMGAGMTATVLAALVANRWFQARRGAVLGALTAAAAAGQLIFLPSLAWFLDQAGWRTAVIGMALIMAAVTMLAFLFLRDRPTDVGLGRYGESFYETTRALEGQRPTGNPIVNAFRVLGQCSRSRDFWILGGAFFVCGLSTNGLIGTHMVASCFDAGIPEVQAAGVVAMMGVFNFIGTTGSGWLSDKFDNRKLLFWFYGLRGVALIWLPMSGYSVYGLAIFAIFFGLDWIATVPPTVRLMGEAVGREKAAMAYGWILVIHQIGAATAAYGAGVMRENLGNYFLAFILIGISCLVAAVLVLGAGRGSQEGKLQPAAA